MRDTSDGRTYNPPTSCPIKKGKRSERRATAFVSDKDEMKMERCMLDKISLHDKEVSQDAVNADVIAALAEETHQPVEIVKDVYEEQFARLSADARITDYLVLFASRRARDVLVHRHT
jgi:hypothetical protein